MYEFPRCDMLVEGNEWRNGEVEEVEVVTKWEREVTRASLVGFMSSLHLDKSSAGGGVIGPGCSCSGALSNLGTESLRYATHFYCPLVLHLHQHPHISIPPPTSSPPTQLTPTSSHRPFDTWHASSNAVLATCFLPALSQLTVLSFSAVCVVPGRMLPPHHPTRNRDDAQSLIGTSGSP